MMGELAKELDFRFIRCGKVLVGNTDEDMETLKRTIRQGEDNGASGLELIDEKRLHELVPAVVGKFAMYSKNSGIVDPFGYTIALAENAHANGAEYHFGCEVTDISRDGRKLLYFHFRGNLLQPLGGKQCRPWMWKNFRSPRNYGIPYHRLQGRLHYSG